MSMISSSCFTGEATVAVLASSLVAARIKNMRNPTFV